MIDRALYSLSTKPLKQFDGRIDCGWFNERYNWIGLALSVFFSKKMFKEIVFVSDKYGSGLASAFRIDFTEIETGFDNSKMPPSLWSLAKLYAIRKQTKSFLHIDGDVFLTKLLPGEYLKADVAVQSLEWFKNYKYYMDTILAMRKNGFELTPLFQYGNRRKVHLATNNGIVGGNNVELLVEYAKAAIDFVNINMAKWNKNPDAFGCTVIEQWMLAVQCNKMQTSITPLLGTSEQWGTIQQQARQLGFHHYISGTKRNQDRCKRMEEVAAQIIPHQLRLINKHFNAG